MSKSIYLLGKLGDPTKPETKNCMVLWRVPQSLRNKIKCLPSKVYCHKSMPGYLEKAFSLIIFRGLESEVKTWDGCFNVRPIRGYKNIWSTHSWGLAIDMNAHENPLGKEPKLSRELVACFDQWFDWGGEFERKDGMHFELKKELI